MKLSDGWIFTPKQDAKDRSKIVVEQSELVRCKNCENYNTECCAEGCGWCHKHDFGTNDEWYCADGVKKSEINMIINEAPTICTGVNINSSACSGCQEFDCFGCEYAKEG